ncbi:MAG: ligase-associated DNA damage response endonuclease PdeM [Saprospiraceae bacterium]|nr:ligase-associated DNA damage response endonuclease PdeM [Saprospiraceae bacterium]
MAYICDKKVIVEIRGQEMVLCPEKTLWWPERKTMYIADVHFGKADHFRKAGIGVPAQLTTREYDRLQLLVDKYGPECIVFLGDLFHSEYNRSVEVFQKWLHDNGGVECVLVRGNHDIMMEEVYAQLGLKLEDQLVEADILFTHEPQPQPGYYNVYGHVHPGVRLSGKGRQGHSLPCFHFTADYGILPAFGLFTGHVRLQVAAHDRVYVIADHQVIQVSP